MGSKDQSSRCRHDRRDRSGRLTTLGTQGDVFGVGASDRASTSLEASKTVRMLVPVLAGRRVRSRPIDHSDRARIVRIRRTEAVVRWWRGDDLDVEFDEDVAQGDLFQFAIESPAGTVVGMIQFSEEGGDEYRHASVDLFVDPAVHRQGIGSDAIITLADYLFDGLGHHRLVIDPSVDNEAAIACYSKVGFERVGVMRAYERRTDGTWSDGLLMDMLSSDRRPT